MSLECIAQPFRLRWKHALLLLFCLSWGMHRTWIMMRERVADHRVCQVTEAITDPYVVEIVCRDKLWFVRYPKESRKNSDSSREIHLPQNTHIVLVLNSADYVYTFAIPELGLKEIAVPDLEFRMEFCPKNCGQYELVGESLCGDPHSDLPGKLVVESHQDFLAWQHK
jgi:heme/copper-type cytochrome/quinol oxidase subunit 2